jgi:16S rRNA (cytosine1402-N4)-methyltransferase
MQKEVIGNLIIDRKGTYLDGTLGGGGHAELILEHLDMSGRLIGLDRDKDAIKFCSRKFEGEKRMTIHQTLFSSMGSYCATDELSGVLLDLGMSFHQVTSTSRGFSFEKGKSLDMRMDADRGPTALDYLLIVSEGDLASALRANSDLRRARSLARAIKARVNQNSDSNLIEQAVKDVYPHGVRNRESLMARIFQALRMEVNCELSEIEKGLESAVECVKPGGRICVITQNSCICPPDIPVCICGNNHRRIRKITKKPLLPSQKEIVQNKRARSAKMRVVEKLENRMRT